MEEEEEEEEEEVRPIGRIRTVVEAKEEVPQTPTERAKELPSSLQTLGATSLENGESVGAFCASGIAQRAPVPGETTVGMLTTMSVAESARI